MFKDPRKNRPTLGLRLPKVALSRLRYLRQGAGEKSHIKLTGVIVIPLRG